MSRTPLTTVYTVGSINLDESVRLVTLPRPGETVLASSVSSAPGGKGANQAIAAAAAGATSVLIGAVGGDDESGSIMTALTGRGVDVDRVETRPGTGTGRAIVYVDDAGENSIVVIAGANAELDGATAERGLSSIAPGDVLLLQNEVPAAVNRAAARVARAAGATVVWNAAPAPSGRDDVIEDIDLLVVNESELDRVASLLGITQAPRDTIALLRLVAEALSSSHEGRGSGVSSAPDAVCTLGAAGAVFATDEATGLIRSPRVAAVDTTAAGDTLVGYLAAHARLDLADRLRVATAAGALAVTRAGASPSIPSIADVHDLLDEHRADGHHAERTPS